MRLADGQGLTSTRIHLGSRSIFDKPDVGVIVIGPRSKEEGTLITVSTLSAPREARKSFEKAEKELRKKRVNVARAKKDLEEAVAAYPAFSAAWEKLGQLELQLENRQAARQALGRAIQSEPNYIPPYLALARLEMFEENWEQAAKWSESIIKLSPASDRGHYFRGISNFMLLRQDVAETSLSFLIRNGHQAKYPIALFYLGVIHSKLGQIAQAIQELTLYLQIMPEDQMPPGQKESIEKQLAQWQRGRP